MHPYPIVDVEGFITLIEQDDSDEEASLGIFTSFKKGEVNPSSFSFEDMWIYLFQTTPLIAELLN